MKKLLSGLLVLVMMISCINFGSALAVDEAGTVDVNTSTATIEAEDYLTDWFSDQLSEHYTLHNFDFTFTTTKCEDGVYDSYGYLEVDHHLKYDSLNELPYVQGMMDALSINSMEAVVNGDFSELQSAADSAVMKTKGTAALSEVQVQSLARELKESLTAVQADMGDFNASYFFHITANFDGANLSNVAVTLEAEDVGYLPAEECLPGTSEELYSDGLGAATEYVLKAASYDENLLASTPKPLTYANYNRIAARDYALQYAKNPSQSCKCGALSYNSSESFPEGVTYSAWNNSVYPYFSVFCHNDCADFVSQAMSAGNLPEGGQWFRKKNVSTQSWGSAWTSVSNMKSYMTSKGYWTPDKYSTCNAGNILLTSSGHVTMITLNNTVTHCYTGHTNDRRNVAFSDKSGYVYYAINLT